MIQEFDYEPRGKTSGSMTNIPVDVCGICGLTMIQPLPTGIWIHSRFPDDYEDTVNHIPRKATQLEMMVILNGSSSDGSDGGCVCYLHQKYWLQELGLDLDNNELENGIPTKLEKYDDPNWPEYHNQYDFGAYWWTHHKRENYLKYAKFIVSRKVKHLKKNFTLEPKVIATFYQGMRINSGQSKDLKITREYKYQAIPEPGDEIKIKNEWFVVINDCTKPKMMDMEKATIHIHVQPRKKAKRWLEQ